MNNCEDRFARCSEIIQRLNGMDDTFFQKLVESKEVYEEIIRIIIGDENICITWVQTQKYLRNCGKRSVILDAIGMSTSDCYYCIEMEKSDKHNHQKRVRYNASNVNTGQIFKITARRTERNVRIGRKICTGSCC